MSENGSIGLFENLMLESNEENDEIIVQLFNDQIEEESTLFLLSTREDLPQIIFNYNISQKKSQFYYKYILGLINLIQKLAQIEDQIIDLWIKSSKQTQNCILSTIFKLLPNCYSELCLPKIVSLMPETESESLEMSFYEYVCCNICGFVSTLNTYQINFVEQLLFDNLLSNECISNLLASDVLCFMARYSNSTLCYNYCCLLFNMSLHLDDYCFVNIVSLLNRLLPFLREIEIDYIIKDYDFVTYSKVWKELKLSQILSLKQINDTFETINSKIENEKIITNENILILKNILISDTIDDKIRQKLCNLFAQNLFISNETQICCDFIELLIVLLPKASNELILKTLTKIGDLFIKTKPNMDLELIASKFLSHLSVVEISNKFENQFIKIMSSTLQLLFAKTQNFYVKHSLLTTMTNISLKSKFLTIITECCQQNNIKNELKYHLKQYKENYVMSENEKLEYLQNRIEFNSKRREPENNEIAIERSQTFSFGECSQNKKRKIDEEIDCVSNTKVDSDIKNETIDVIERCVKNLKENKALIRTPNVKQRLMTVYYELTDIIDRIKVE